MKLKYLGHSAFLITAGTGTRIVTDPYDLSVGYPMPEVEAEAVTVSHHHFDHDYADGVDGDHVVYDKAGSYSLPGVEISAFESFHDEQGGRLRGSNLIFKFKGDGVSICHLGDIGERCTPEIVKAIGYVNVLIIPVGGNYTIDAAQAKEYVDKIMPDVVIPMHYFVEGCEIKINPVSNFISAFGGDFAVQKVKGELKLNPDDLDGDTVKIIVMDRSAD